MTVFTLPYRHRNERAALSPGANQPMGYLPRSALWCIALLAMLLTACGSVPVSSLWKLRKLQLETLDPVALRVAVVHGPALQLYGQSLVLSVSVSRKVRLPGGTTTTELLAEKLPLQELRSTTERSLLAEYDKPQTVVQIWRIDPAALHRLQALRTNALAWKGTDDGQRELSLGLELAGCQQPGAQKRLVTTLMRFADPGEYIPILRNLDLAETMPAADLSQRFPVCAAG